MQEAGADVHITGSHLTNETEFYCSLVSNFISRHVVGIYAQAPPLIVGLHNQ